MTGVCRLLVVLWVMIGCMAPAVTKAGDEPEPLIPKGKGERCVEETGYMRRNHMELLKHQRDETLYKGIRTKRHSLQECIACHTVLGSNGRPVTIASPEHFCNVCHAYVAVTPDCFMCHASTPGPSDPLPFGDSNKGK